MKHIAFIILSVIPLMLISCNSQTSEIPVNDFIDRPVMGLQLVKFKSPEYVKYVAAESVTVEWDTIKGYPSDKLVGKKSAYKIRGAGGTCQELFLGQSPYIELIDNYYLVDWKWGYFIYHPSNVLLDVVWTDVNDRQELWDLETSIVSSDFIEEWGAVNRNNIDSYLQITPAPNDKHINVSTDHISPPWYGYFHTLTEVQESLTKEESFSVDDYMNEVKRQDSLQLVYVERLKQIIQNGEMEKIANVYYHIYKN